MILYTSGPMSGLPSFNIPAFDDLARELRSHGHEVVSPAELDDPAFRLVCLKSPDGKLDGMGETWGNLLARDVKLLADDGIEGVVVLPGWTKSRGALLETFVARLCGLPIYFWHGKRLYPVGPMRLEDAHGEAAGLLNEINSLPSVEPPLPPEQYREQASRYFAQARTKEGETRQTDPTTGAEKAVKDEVEGDLCPKAMIQLAKVCGFGRRKYARLNYLKGYAWSSSYDAMQRHLKAFWAGEEINDESGLHHLAHGAWHALALLAYTIRKVGTDDRP